MKNLQDIIKDYLTFCRTQKRLDSKTLKAYSTSTYPDVADKDVKYINEKSNKLKSKKISVEISLPFFNFSYTSEKSQQNQN